ncbi:Uma2 family endonuclease [Desulfobacterales bacterium HSG2]|nr:Uma2 family endonuclease [Desulfobacterales bacterium HSG2]
MGTNRSESAFSDCTLCDDAAHTEDIDYGYRTLIDYDENGNPSYSDRPLTLDDFLEPEEGDVYLQGNVHVDDVYRLKSIFRHHLRDRKNVTVYSDLKIIWGMEGIPNPAPDISIFKDVKDPKKSREHFYVPEEGVRPFFILEVVSPIYRDPDVNKKPEIYRKAGVSEYMIIDPGLENKEISYTVSGYSLIDGEYVKMRPDSRGRFHSMTTDVHISVSESGDRFIVYDARLGKVLLPADERAELEKTRADNAKIRAELAKSRADNAESRAELAKSRANNAEIQVAKIQAELAKTRADNTEKEIIRLKAKMKAMGISAD